MSQMTVKLSTDIYFWELCFIYLDSEFGWMNNILVDGVFKVSNIPIEVMLHSDAYTASRHIESQTNTKHRQRWGWGESADREKIHRRGRRKIDGRDNRQNIDRQ